MPLQHILNWLRKKRTQSLFQHKKQIFQFQNRKAFINIPQQAAKGNPWVWRARFPDFHTEIDMALLNFGFHIVHLDMTDLHGGPKSIQLWDDFYTDVTEQFNLSKRVTLEGVSRGGLVMYAWTKRNGEKLDCIYGDTAVCDIKSWPYGSGVGKKSQVDWELILEEYGMTEAEALNYTDNPMENLENLASNKVPILHVVGMNDTVVPPLENSFILQKNYRALGGQMEIIENKWGKEELEGHHFILDAPGRAMDFILENTRNLRKCPDGKKYFTLRENLWNSYQKFTQTKQGTVAFIGGSITYNQGWRDWVFDWIQSKFPSSKLNMINAGIPSTGSTFGAFRLKRDVFQAQTRVKPKNVDLLFVEFAVNDYYSGRISKEPLRGMEGIIRQARKLNPNIDIVLLYCVDPFKIEHYQQNSHKGDSKVIAQYESITQKYQISCINLAQEVSDRLTHKEFSWEKDFVDLHPSTFGKKLYFRSIRKFLTEAWIRILDERIKITSRSLEKKSPLDNFSYSTGELIPASEINFDTNWAVITPKKLLKRRFLDEWLRREPILEATSPSSSLSLEFSGTAIGIYLISGPDVGKIEYNIDGSGWKIRDQFTAWSEGTHLGWSLMLDTELEDKNHQVSIRILEEKNEKSLGTACRIIYFLVNR
jgi:pimeloyl-ACP methyl ester carboxylesterase